MSHTATFNLVKTLVKQGLISDEDLASFANTKLAEGKAVVAAPVAGAPVKRRKRPVKAEAAPKVSKEAKVRKAPVRAQATDGRTNKHAILVAIAELEDTADGCTSKSLQAKLAEIGHPLGVATFHTQLSTLQSKDGAVKAKGKLRHNKYSLSAVGKKMLAELNDGSVEAVESVE